MADLENTKTGSAAAVAPTAVLESVMTILDYAWSVSLALSILAGRNPRRDRARRARMLVAQRMNTKQHRAHPRLITLARCAMKAAVVASAPQRRIAFPVRQASATVAAACVARVFVKLARTAVMNPIATAVFAPLGRVKRTRALMVSATGRKPTLIAGVLTATPVGLELNAWGTMIVNMERGATHATRDCVLLAHPRALRVPAGRRQIVQPVHLRTIERAIDVCCARNT